MLTPWDNEIHVLRESMFSITKFNAGFKKLYFKKTETYSYSEAQHKKQTKAKQFC